MKWIIERLLEAILFAVVSAAALAAIPPVRSKVRDLATGAWQAMARFRSRLLFWVTVGTKERRDARFAKRVKEAQKRDIEMMGDAIDAHGFALSALQEIIETMLFPEELGNGKKYLPKHAKMAAWFMLRRYLSHTVHFDVGDTRTIAAYRKKHSQKGPGGWTTNLKCHSSDAFSTEFIDQMNGGPRRFNREMKNGESLNIKIVQGFYLFPGHPKFKCYVWVGQMWDAHVGSELGLEEAYRRAKEIRSVRGGWKEEKQ